MAIAALFDRLGHWNPQLHRELRSRMTRTHLLLTAALSLVVQVSFWGLWRFLVSASAFAGGVATDQFTPAALDIRYICASSHPAAAIYATPWRFPLDHFAPICPDSDIAAARIPALNWPLAWLDFLTAFSGIGFALLLLGSLVLLLHNLLRETRTGTLDLLRLSPESAASVLIGKLGGVASLLYWSLLLAVPLQLWAAHRAWLGIGRVLVFDGLAIAATLSVQVVATAIALSAAAPRTRKAPSVWLLELSWFGVPAGLLGALAFIRPSFGNDLLAFSPLDAVKGLNPLFFWPYVLAQAPHSLATIGYLNVKDWQQLNWFGWHLWERPAIAGSITLVAWVAIATPFWQSSRRRYAQPETPVLSKAQSYWLSAGISIVAFGFACQDAGWQDYSLNLNRNFYALFASLLFWLLSLGLLLRPSRQAVLEWSRYRHQQSQRPLTSELLWHDRAPAVLAVAVNVAIVSAILLVGVIVAPLGSARGMAIAAILCGASFALVWASGWQWLGLATARQHWQGFGSLLVAPATVAGALGLAAFGPALASQTASLFPAALWLLLGEWLAIALTTSQLVRVTHRLGTGAVLQPPPTGKREATAARLPRRDQNSGLGKDHV